MNHLLPVRTENINGQKQRAVSIRELVENLGIETAPTTWFQRQVEKYEFIENEDFLPFLKESIGGRPSQDYIVPLDTAKELCMIANTEQGKIIRKYFIAIEKKSMYNTTQYEKKLPSSFSETLKMLAEEVEKTEELQKMLHTTSKTLSSISKANQAIIVLNDEIVEAKAKEFKTVHNSLKSDIGAEINAIILNLYLDEANGIYPVAHRIARDRFQSNTGRAYLGAKYASLSTKKDYLQWLQTQLDSKSMQLS